MRKTGMALDVGTRERLHAWVYRTLSDRLMTELAVLILPATILPILFDFSPIMLGLFAFINYSILAVFAVEYILKLVSAESPRNFARDPWHLLDLLVLVLAAMDFLPFIALKGGRASPALRLLRLLRFFALTGRTLGRVSSGATRAAAAPALLEINVLEEGVVRHGASWAMATDSVTNPKETWIDVQNISRDDLEDLERTFHLPRHVLESKLFEKSFPGIDYFRDYSIFVLWDLKSGTVADGKHGAEHVNIVVICSKDYLATLCVGRNGLFSTLMDKGLPLADESFSVRVLYEILHLKIMDFKAFLLALEQHVAELEENPSGRASPAFLDSTFNLKKLIQKQDYNLRHFVPVLLHVSKRRVALHNMRNESLELFTLLHDEAASLSDTCHVIRENLVSLIDLQLNRVSFDLNRVMRILAILSCLSLVPAVIGGMLGENLVDQPFNITLPEVFSIVVALMLAGLYIFYRMGWLK